MNEPLSKSIKIILTGSSKVIQVRQEGSPLLNAVKIIHLRNQHPALRYGDFQTLLADENVYVYLRSDLNERVLVAINKSKQPQEIKIKLPDFYNLKSESHPVSFSLPAVSWKVMEIE